MDRRYPLPRGPWGQRTAEGEPLARLVALPVGAPATVAANRAVSTLLQVTGAGAPVALHEALTTYRRMWKASEDTAFQALLLAGIDRRELVAWTLTGTAPVQFALVVLRDLDGHRVGPARRWQT